MDGRQAKPATSGLPFTSRIPGEGLLLSPFGLATRGERQGEAEPLLSNRRRPSGSTPDRSRRPSGSDQKVPTGRLGATAAFFIVLLIGVGGCMYCEGWGPIASLYVITQMITTVGYGDFTVTSEYMRLFMAFYGILCLVLLAYFINLYLQRVVEWQSNAIRGYLRRFEVNADNEVDTEEEATKKYGSLNRVVAAASMFLFLIIFGTIFFRLYEHCACPDIDDFIQKDQTCVDSNFQLCQASGGFVKTWADALYMSVITLTTIGFGDYQARSTVGRLVGSIWMLVGVVVAVNFVDSLSAWFFEDASHEIFEEKDLLEEMNEETFKRMDMKGDGQISRSEFMVYTLLKYGLVKEDVLATIDKTFDRIASPTADHIKLVQIQGSNSQVVQRAKRRRASVLF